MATRTNDAVASGSDVTLTFHAPIAGRLKRKQASRNWPGQNPVAARNSWHFPATGNKDQAQSAADNSQTDNVVRRNRSALPTTDTELRLIASAAIIGESSTPNTGYSTPAAIGTPSVL